MHTKKSIIFYKKNYINIVLHRFGMLNYNSSSIIMNKDIRLQINMHEELVDNVEYCIFIRSF